jgi:hypothetical protein
MNSTKNRRFLIKIIEYAEIAKKRIIIKIYSNAVLVEISFVTIAGKIIVGVMERHHH